MAKYRKKPVVIEAVQWSGTNQKEITLFGDGNIHFVDILPSGSGPRIKDATPRIQTLEGILSASIGDWIIQGVKGEVYPCKPDIFEATYERV